MKTQFTNGARVRARGSHNAKTTERSTIERYEGEGFYLLNVYTSNGPGHSEVQTRVVHEDDMELVAVTSVLDAGHRERQALLKFWGQENDFGMPFQEMLLRTSYDPHADAFLMPDKNRVATVEYCSQLGSSDAVVVP